MRLRLYFGFPRSCIDHTCIVLRIVFFCVYFQNFLRCVRKLTYVANVPTSINILCNRCFFAWQGFIFKPLLNSVVPNANFLFKTTFELLVKISCTETRFWKCSQCRQAWLEEPTSGVNSADKEVRDTPSVIEYIFGILNLFFWKAFGLQSGRKTDWSIYKRK